MIVVNFEKNTSNELNFRTLVVQEVDRAGVKKLGNHSYERFDFDIGPGRDTFRHYWSKRTPPEFFVVYILAKLVF